MIIRTEMNLVERPLKSKLLELWDSNAPDPKLVILRPLVLGQKPTRHGVVAVSAVYSVGHERETRQGRDIEITLLNTTHTRTHTVSFHRLYAPRHLSIHTHEQSLHTHETYG